MFPLNRATVRVLMNLNHGDSKSSASGTCSMAFSSCLSSVVSSIGPMTSETGIISFRVVLGITSAMCK